MRTAVAGLPLVALAACSGGGDAPSALPPGAAPATSAAPGSASSSAPAAPADQVRTAYLRYWDAVVAAHRAADPRSPALARAAGGAQLAKVRAAVDRNRLQRVSLRGEVTHDVSVPEVRGATATLEDCYDISGWDPVSLRTGKPIDVTEEGGTGRYRSRFTLTRSRSGWVVISDTSLGGC